ncbi:MAG: DUF4013 domain-containing protein [Methanobacteriaceae archaeon]|nr:DUF4013 domain-containing protein [Methanobacteriaceae archaeon]
MVNIINTFHEAFTYSKQNIRRLLFIGLIAVIGDLNNILENINIPDEIGIILGIITIIAALILAGFEHGIIRETSNFNNEIPHFSWIENIKEGINVWLQEIIFCILPLSIILGIFLIAFNDSVLHDFIILLIQNNGIIASYALTDPIIEHVILLFIVAFILFAICELFWLISICRLAKYGKLREGLNFIGIIKDLNQLGWGSVLLWVIVLAIFTGVLTFIGSLVKMIPFIGHLIVALIILPFTLLFTGAATGFLYSYVK